MVGFALTAPGKGCWHLTASDRIEEDKIFRFVDANRLL